MSSRPVRYLRADAQGARETLDVELTNALGRASGVASVDEAHRTPLLHRAFSVFLKDDRGRILLQRRSAAKLRFPGLWANSCCGHPLPGQAVAAAAAIRVNEELGLHVRTFQAVGAFVYRAADHGTAYTEFEYDHVLTATVERTVLRADPTEISAHRWVSPSEVDSLLMLHPHKLVPWFAEAWKLVCLAKSDGQQENPIRRMHD